MTEKKIKRQTVLTRKQIVALTRFLIANKDSLDNKLASDIAYAVNNQCEGITNCTEHHAAVYGRECGLHVGAAKTLKGKHGLFTTVQNIKSNITSLDERTALLEEKYADLQADMNRVLEHITGFPKLAS